MDVCACVRVCIYRFFYVLQLSTQQIDTEHIKYMSKYTVYIEEFISFT